MGIKGMFQKFSAGTGLDPPQQRTLDTHRPAYFKTTLYVLFTPFPLTVTM
jgi:hypothetical protein